jgi:hypothetical protein
MWLVVESNVREDRVYRATQHIGSDRFYLRYRVEPRLVACVSAAKLRGHESDLDTARVLPRLLTDVVRRFVGNLHGIRVDNAAFLDKDPDGIPQE